MLYGPFASSFKSIVKSQPNYSRLSIFIGQGNSVVALLFTTQPSGGSFPALESRWLPCCGVWRTTPQALLPVPPIDSPPPSLIFAAAMKQALFIWRPEHWTQAADSGSQFVFDLSISKYTVGVRSVGDIFRKDIDRNCQERVWHRRLSSPEWALVDGLTCSFFWCPLWLEGFLYV